MTITFSLLLLNCTGLKPKTSDVTIAIWGKYNSPGLSYESPEICGAERNYLENSNQLISKTLISMAIILKPAMKILSDPPKMRALYDEKLLER